MVVHVVFVKIKGGKAGLQLSVLGRSQTDRSFSDAETVVVRTLAKMLAALPETELRGFSVREPEDGLQDCVVISALPTSKGVARVLSLFEQAVIGFELLEESKPGRIKIVKKEKNERTKYE